ncbi:hypothetical protein SAMN04489730_6529 [Amycolatopsis australiensis]|uniref:Uncharacterized protein n=1 Tax=Amycolatopsis australiensis TaxID=546364 RepID=A0A1K1SRE6_9PSEU|nr:hypothetical protein SAMN04489730_6529 [Amycolatopsis australiensis]
MRLARKDQKKDGKQEKRNAVQGRDTGPTPERARQQAHDVRLARKDQKKDGKQEKRNAVQGRDTGPTPERARQQAHDVRLARKDQKKDENFLAEVQNMFKEGARAKGNDPIERVSDPLLVAKDQQQRKRQVSEVARKAPTRKVPDPKMVAEQQQLQPREAERRKAISADNDKGPEQMREASRQEQTRHRQAAVRPPRQPASLAAAQVRTAAPADQNKAEEKDPPSGSNALCFGVHLQGVGAGAGGDSCLVFDRRGVGFANSQHVGPGLGFGAEATISAKGSNANIDELTGRSIYGTVGMAAGPGVEINGSVSEDRKYLNDSVGVGVGVEASASGGLEYTDARRLFDWTDVLPEPKVSVMAPGSLSAGPAS